MVVFNTLLKKFDSMGEKTGWTYLSVPKKVAEQLKPNNKKSFRVKGKLDGFNIKAVALLPMGDGDFVLAVNAAMRKGLKKIHGATVIVSLEEDKDELKIAEDLIRCLEDDPAASAYFLALPPSHKNWYSNWVQAAKTDVTKSKRIAAVLKGCGLRLSFGEMIKTYREDRTDFK